MWWRRSFARGPEVRSPMSSIVSDPAGSAQGLEVVPLGGLGEFGMNMMAVSWGETHHRHRCRRACSRSRSCSASIWSSPICTYLQEPGRKVAALVLTHGHEDHIGAVPHVVAACRRPGLRHAAHAGAASSRSSRSTASTRAAGCVPVRPRDSVTVGAVHDRVHPRHPQHAGLRGAGHPHAGRRDHPHRRLQDRPDAARRRALRPAPLRRTGRRGRAGAVLATAPTSTGAASPGSERDVVDAFEEIFAAHDGQARRRRRSPRASTGCRSWSTWRRSSTARWRSSAAA